MILFKSESELSTNNRCKNDKPFTFPVKDISSLVFYYPGTATGTQTIDCATGLQVTPFFQNYGIYTAPNGDTYTLIRLEGVPPTCFTIRFGGDNGYLYSEQFHYLPNNPCPDPVFVLKSDTCTEYDFMGRYLGEGQLVSSNGGLAPTKYSNEVTLWGSLKKKAPKFNFDLFGDCEISGSNYVETFELFSAFIPLNIEPYISSILIGGKVIINSSEYIFRGDQPYSSYPASTCICDLKLSTTVEKCPINVVCNCPPKEVCCLYMQALADGQTTMVTITEYNNNILELPSVANSYDNDTGKAVPFYCYQTGNEPISVVAQSGAIETLCGQEQMECNCELFTSSLQIQCCQSAVGCDITLDITSCDFVPPFPPGVTQITLTTSGGAWSIVEREEAYNVWTTLDLINNSPYLGIINLEDFIIDEIRLRVQVGDCYVYFKFISTVATMTPPDLCGEFGIEILYTQNVNNSVEEGIKAIIGIGGSPCTVYSVNNGYINGSYNDAAGITPYIGQCIPLSSILPLDLFPILYPKFLTFRTEIVGECGNLLIKKAISNIPNKQLGCNCYQLWNIGDVTPYLVIDSGCPPDALVICWSDVLLSPFVDHNTLNDYINTPLNTQVPSMPVSWKGCGGSANYTSMETIGNCQYFYGGSNVNVGSRFVSGTTCDSWDDVNKLWEILSIDDQGGSITSMGSFCFKPCDDQPAHKIKYIRLPNLQSMGNYNIMTLLSLETVLLPNCLTIGSENFQDLGNMGSVFTTLDLSSLVTAIDSNFIRMHGLTTMTLPSATSLGHYNVYWNHSLLVFSAANLLTAGQQFLSKCIATTTAIMNVLNSTGAGSFSEMTACTSIITNLTNLGGGAGANNCFILGTAKPSLSITVDTVLQTNNAGNPDGDLVYAISQGSTVNYI